MLGNTPDVIGAVRALEARAHLVGFNMLRVGKDYKNKRRVLDLSRFDAAPLIAFTATKEMNYETDPNGRIP